MDSDRLATERYRSHEVWGYAGSLTQPSKADARFLEGWGGGSVTRILAAGAVGGTDGAESVITLQTSGNREEREQITNQLRQELEDSGTLRNREEGKKKTIPHTLLVLRALRTRAQDVWIVEVMSA